MRKCFATTFPFPVGYLDNHQNIISLFPTTFHHFPIGLTTGKATNHKINKRTRKILKISLLYWELYYIMCNHVVCECLLNESYFSSERRAIFQRSHKTWPESHTAAIVDETWYAVSISCLFLWSKDLSVCGLLIRGAWDVNKIYRKYQMN